MATIASAVIVSWTPSDPKAAQQAPQAPQVANNGSLGTTSVTGAGYNQTFQERMQQSVTASMDAMRAESAAQRDAWAKEQQMREEARDEAFKQRMEQLEQSMAQQAQPSRASTQVEKFKFIPTDGSAEKKAGMEAGFVGSPSDVKPMMNESADTGQPNEAKREVTGLNIPPNGFIKARTLNGVVAVVGAPASGFLAKLQGRYRSANGFVVNLDSCTVYLEGRADLAAGRVMGKPATMTCNFPDGASKTWQVSGYAVDNDGIEGIVGVINDNGGKKLLGSSVGGGIALAGSALSRAQATSYTSGTGTAQAVTGSVGADIAGGLIQGAGSELSKQVGEHYNQYKASVQVGGGREITIVLLNELEVPSEGKTITSTRAAQKTKGS